MTLFPGYGRADGTSSKSESSSDELIHFTGSFFLFDKLKFFLNVDSKYYVPNHQYEEDRIQNPNQGPVVVRFYVV